MLDIRVRLATGQPLDLLAEVSSMLAAFDPRDRNPFHGNEGERHGGTTLFDVVSAFADADFVETSALLAAMAHMSSDELVRTKARRALRDRSSVLPSWLERLGETEVYRAVEMTHVLGDGDDVILGIRLPLEHELTIVVFIDHNMGTVVKDAFVIPEPISDVLGLMQRKNGDPDTSWNELTLADARVRIMEAIELGAMTYPPFESDTWPACRPITEWILRLLPEGGTGYIRPEWDEDQTDDLARRFFESPHGSALDDKDNRQLLDSILWFGTGYGTGDPLRWSTVACEILLLDWIPRKIVAGADYLSAAPTLLRSFVRFCHDELQIRTALTDETIDIIDQLEPEYQRIIRSPRPQGPAALLAAIGVIDPDSEWDLEVDDYEGSRLLWLGEAVGGTDELLMLEDDVLPDEPFDWTGIPDDVQPTVNEILRLSDQYCDEILDTEFRTACRRLLNRMAIGNPNVFRRKARSETAAAALCWIIGKANDAFVFAPYGRGILVKDLTSYFGLAQNGVSQKAQTLLKAAGLEQGTRYGAMNLGLPELLVSARRRNIIRTRDLLTDT
jgi:hypothetical protein